MLIFVGDITKGNKGVGRYEVCHFKIQKTEARLA